MVKSTATVTILGGRSGTLGMSNALVDGMIEAGTAEDLIVEEDVRKQMTSQNSQLIKTKMKAIRGLLTRDAIERRTRKWRLLSQKEMDDVLQKTYRDFSREECYFIVPVKYPMKISTWKEVEWTTICRLRDKFVYLQKLLDQFKGQIVAAGGAICRAYTYNQTEGDVDLFFVDQVISQPEKYTTLLASAVSFLISGLLSKPGGTVYVTRNEYVTSVYYYSEFDQDQKYQFIHRVYPSIGSILGGFDIGVCMVAYDGERIIATELGAWSLLNKTIIIDTSRRSTSYEHRLTKYVRFFNIIFPGLDAAKVEESFKDWKKGEEVICGLKQILEKENVRVQYIDGECPGFFLEEEEQDREEIEAKIYALARENGYIVRDIELSPISKPDSNGRTMNFELEDKMRLLLKSYAYERGFHLDIDEFKSSALNDYDSWGLISRKRVFKMPYLSIKTKAGHAGPYVFCTKMSSGKPRYVSEPSDYDNSPTYADMTALENVTYLVGGRYLKGAMSIVVFKRHGDEKQPERLESLDYGEVMETIKHVHEETELARIHEIIESSFNAPYLGELKLALEMRYETYLRMKDRERETSFKRSVFSLFGSNEERDVEILSQEIEANAILATENLKGVKWILENPGRQWTSSINPIMKDPRDWYGSSYRSFRIGCLEVETCLRLCKLRKDSPFYGMDKNIFNYIIRLVVWENSYLM